MHRYYNVSQSNAVDLQKDCVTHVYTNIKNYVPGKQKTYSYISTMVKNYIYENVVRIPNTVKRINIDYTDEAYILEESHTINYGSPPEYDFKAVREYFLQVKDNVVLRMKALDKRYKSGVKKKGYDKHNFERIQGKYLKWLDVVDLSLEFMEKFNSINPNHMAEYVYSKRDVSRAYTISIFRTLFNVNVSIPDDKIGFQDDKKGYDYVNDDYTDIEIKWQKRQNRRRLNDLNQKDYNYF